LHVISRCAAEATGNRATAQTIHTPEQPQEQDSIWSTVEVAPHPETPPIQPLESPPAEPDSDDPLALPVSIAPAHVDEGSRPKRARAKSGFYNALEGREEVNRWLLPSYSTTSKSHPALNFSTFHTFHYYAMKSYRNCMINSSK
jgi:hypothetical protein